MAKYHRRASLESKSQYSRYKTRLSLLGGKYHPRYRTNKQMDARWTLPICTAKLVPAEATKQVLMQLSVLLLLNQHWIYLPRGHIRSPFHYTSQRNEKKGRISLTCMQQIWDLVKLKLVNCQTEKSRKERKKKKKKKKKVCIVVIARWGPRTRINTRSWMNTDHWIQQKCRLQTSFHSHSCSFQTQE